MDFGLKKSKNKLSEEAAHDQVMMLLDHYGIDVEDIEDVKTKDSTISTLNKVVGFVRRGLVEIGKSDNVLTVVQNLQSPAGDVKTLEYSEVKGKHKTAMDGKGDDHNYGKCYALAGSLTSMGETAIKSLTGQDLSVVECLGSVFLQV